MNRPRFLERLDALAFRCKGCGAWRLPEQYMRRDHQCRGWHGRK